MSTAQQQMEDLQRELATLGRQIAEALGLPRFVDWLNTKLERRADQ